MDDISEKFSAKGRAEWAAYERRALISRILRWVFGIPLMLFCFPIPWFGPFLVLLGVILVAPDLARFAAGSLGGIMWRHTSDGPRPIYGIPEALAARGKYAEAEAEYEKIIQEFPGEVKPHIDLINIAVTRLKDAELAERLYRRGMETLKEPAARETLTRMYEGISSILKTRGHGVVARIGLQFRRRG
jgi:tetratricopeptide (TPR) repeat protein